MLNYPLTLSFKILALAPQVKVTDANGQTVLYVRQKVLALREDVKVFSDESQHHQIYQINADRIIDWSARYRITDTKGEVLGVVRREGMRSLWKATYHISDANEQDVGLIHEENPWIKVLDAFAGMVLQWFINPAYLVDLHGRTTLYLKKRPAFFEGRFTLDRRADMNERDEALLVTSVLMMLLLERSRG